MSEADETLTGKAAKRAGDVFTDAISQRNRGHWSEFLLLVLLGDHLGMWEVAAFTDGSMTAADVALIMGGIARLLSQFGPGGGKRRASDG